MKNKTYYGKVKININQIKKYDEWNEENKKLFIRPY